ncbi:MAG TPA: iron chelate uptake ABC transporter family permease subunit, partial [Acidimicrobiales bacterium]|nr:iron chelate uptake ABC transporter family permease subunit [Acidimicrobiales bacterium]
MSVRGPVAVAFGALLGAVLVGVSVGPADVSLPAVLRVVASHVPLLHYRSGVSPVSAAIVWEIRLPRVVLGGIVGAMLAGGGAAYQGVFRNPLADPYLLGVAAGAGLGATVVIVSGPRLSELLPPAAFVGAVAAVTLTYAVGSRVGRHGATASIVLAGVAVAALLTAVQTYLQQQHSQDLQTVYGWILGQLTTATWSDVVLILPYAAVSALALLAHRRLLD